MDDFKQLKKTGPLPALLLAPSTSLTDEENYNCMNQLYHSTVAFTAGNPVTHDTSEEGTPSLHDSNKQQPTSAFNTGAPITLPMIPHTGEDSWHLYNILQSPQSNFHSRGGSLYPTQPASCGSPNVYRCEEGNMLGYDDVFRPTLGDTKDYLTLNPGPGLDVPNVLDDSGSLNQAQQRGGEHPTVEGNTKYVDVRCHQYISIRRLPSLDLFSSEEVLGNRTFMPFPDCLAGHTMLNAMFDSPARYPPPRCHPGTRQDILDSIQKRLNDLEKKVDVSWLEGPAGVGKSAIMQTFAERAAENNILGASLFFSRPSHRDDPHKVFTTIAYQLATKLPLYQQYLVQQMAADSAFLEKTMEDQFKALIVTPFSKKQLLGDHRSYLILLDGLNECKGTQEQCRIVKLIGDFASEHRNAPFRWIIASRPEQHLIDAFSEIKPLLQSFWPMNIPIDSKQSVRDVELYLNHEFTRIRGHYRNLLASSEEWPSGKQLSAVSRAASGLFIFASTVIRFIDDEEDPVRQLNVIVSFIEEQLNQWNTWINPLPLLDALYIRILSSV